MRSPKLQDPQARWERTRTFPKLDRSLIRRIFARWPSLAQQHWTLLSDDRHTLLLRAGDVVARVDFGDPMAVRREAAVLHALDGSVRVPRVLDAAEGVLLLEYLRHEALPADELAGRRVGMAAAGIHALAFEGAGPLGESFEVATTCSSALQGLRSGVEERLAQGASERLGSLAGEVLALWDRHAALMSEVSEQAVLVHADFGAGNLKWLPLEQDVLVLDWKHAWAGPALVDIGQLLRWRPPPAFVRGFSQGYAARGGALPKHWEQVAALFDLFDLVGLLARAKPHEQRQRDVLRRISETLTNVNAARF